MAQGKHQAPRPQRSQRRASRLPLILSVILLLSLSVGGTLAYIATQTDNVQNSFAPSYVTCSVNDDYSVTNTSDIPAYIRASYAVNWMDGRGNIRGVGPADTDYTLSIGSDWTKGADGFYYYLRPVAVGGTVSAPFTMSPGTTSAPDGYSLTLTVTAEAIQAAGDTDDTSVPAYKNAWPDAPVLGN